jgi:hypothetical protein
MKYDIRTKMLGNGRYRWLVLDSKTGSQVACGEEDHRGQARHEAFEARRKMPDLPALERVYYDLLDIEQKLGSEIMDAQEREEDRCERYDLAYDDFAEQDDGTMQGIVYPENAAPELDSVRTHVMDAYQALEEFFNLNRGDQDG